MVHERWHKAGEKCAKSSEENNGGKRSSAEPYQ